MLRIILSIGNVETNHFAVWHDKAGNAVNSPLAGVVDPVTGVKYPNLNAAPFGGERFQTNLIFPEPCHFIGQLPPCSIIRPTLAANAGAVATISSFTADLLFDGQSQTFFDTVLELADKADDAFRDTPERRGQEAARG